MTADEASSADHPTPEILPVEDPRAFAAEARTNPRNRVVWVPRSVRSKDTLLRLFADALHFPRYFRRNWDAFEESLREYLASLPEHGALIIVHEHVPFGEGENHTTYFEILLSAAANRTDGHSLQIVVPG
ncbi:Barstar (barnase inhibitor) [Anatilimnocola aggregata]|uniref:Barstar (Barnase inhibitor) n=1 Tax=Anatilimnocola aggregata TaxID=2528021 RepID=A0A517YAT7_9BACT|nr:barstar family protein [Anatilimnocola aggregata]QDU27348.1 Barstar (barnase inhibitor) [Anatilimnocola aggregata]